MRKILPFLIATGILVVPAVFVYAAQSVQVTAIVGSLNHAPVVTAVSPSNNPKMLGRNKIQNYTVTFRDDEKDIVYYTITPVAGYANPTSGVINPSDYDSGSGATINFTYLAPVTLPSPNPTSVTVTLNDGPNLVNKIINLFIF